MKAIQEWLGHSNFSTTANLYAHLEYESKLEAAQTISNKLTHAFDVVSQSPDNMAKQKQKSPSVKENKRKPATTKEKEPLELPA